MLVSLVGTKIKTPLNISGPFKDKKERTPQIPGFASSKFLFVRWFVTIVFDDPLTGNTNLS